MTVIAFGAQAADQAIQLEHRRYDSQPLNSPAEDTAAFWEHFKATFGRRADDVFSDRLDPFYYIVQKRGIGEDGAEFRDYPGKAGRGAVSRSLVYSFREAFFDLPGMVWLKGRQDIFSEIIRNSVDSVGEESVSPKDVSYRAVEQSWWKELSEKGGLQYGIRPFRSSPYAFLSFNVTDGHESILLGHLRYHYSNFREHNFEFELAVPITRNVTMGFGSSFKISGHDEDEKAVGVTLVKRFRSGGFMHLGASVSQHPSLFASLTRPW